MKLSTGSFAAERLTALAATLAAALVSTLTMRIGASLPDVVGAGLIAYVLTVVGVSFKVPLTLLKVLSSTTKGALIGAVVTVVVLIGIWRSVRGL